MGQSAFLRDMFHSARALLCCFINLYCRRSRLHTSARDMRAADGSGDNLWLCLDKVKNSGVPSGLRVLSQLIWRDCVHSCMYIYLSVYVIV